MAPAPDLLGLGSGQDLGQVVHPDAKAARLADPVDAGEELLGGHRAIEAFPRLEAVVAGPAVVQREALAEVAEQFAAPAGGAFGVVHDLPQLGPGHSAFMLVGDLIEKVRLLGDVSRAEKEQAVAGQAVAAGPAGLLIIALDVLRQVVVQDPADIRLVDPHAEGDGRADNPHFVPEELLLAAGPLGPVEPGMIGMGRKAVLGQGRGDPLGRRAAGAVDDPAFGLAGPRPGQDLLQGLVLRDHPVGEIGPVEAGDEHRRLPQAQVGDDIRPDPVGRRGGERHHRHLGQGLAQARELAVLRPEVVPPFGYAMGLVDGQGADVPLAKVLLPAIEEQPLRGGVQQLVLPSVQPAEAGPGGFAIEAGIEERRGDAARLQGIHLVLHQGDQRRDHHGEARPGQGRQLEAEGLASAGRQQGENVPARQGRLDDLPLVGAERIIAERAPQEGGQVGVGGCGGGGHAGVIDDGRSVRGNKKRRQKAAARILPGSFNI